MSIEKNKNTTKGAYLFEPEPRGHYQSRARTGKPVRMLRSQLTEAWEQPEAPPFLQMPLQTAVMVESRLRAERARDKHFLTYPVGQIVGRMNAVRPTAEVMAELIDGCTATLERLCGQSR